MNTQATKVSRQKDGETALALLNNPKGWKIEVWYNMGWHYCLNCGAISIHETRDGKFTAYLSDKIGDNGGGCCNWHTGFTSKDPNEVIAHELAAAKAYLDQCQKAIDSVSI